MKYNPGIHHRRSIRLKGYDYSQNGAYFITICAQNRECLFGEIVDEKIKLNDAGKMIDVQWDALLNRFSNIQLDEYVVMPNHFHGIIAIVQIVGAPLVGAQNRVGCGTEIRAGTRPAPTDAQIPTDTPNVSVGATNPTIGDIIGAFKSITTHEYVNGVKTRHWPFFDKKLWQRNYYENIVRDKNSLNRIREYIINNPKNWKQDELFLI
ncbi:transposase [Candidatus Peregrinibacteria bacterium]|nr:transposase [Candidatus Peregrinibacteria bacterium]